jgi:cell division septation protein DedD
VSQITEGRGVGAPAWLPPEARRILLVGDSAGGNWAGVAAVEVADLVGRHRPRTLLVNTVAGAHGPDGVLGAEIRPGLAEVVGGDRRVGEVAATPQGRSFIFVSAGQASPGIGHLCRAASFQHLVRAAGRGGTLLLHVAEVDLPDLLRESAAGDGLEFDGLVLLGDASVPPGLPPEVRLLARVETEAPAPGPSPTHQGAGGRKPGFTRPSRTPAIVAGGGARRRPRGRFGQLVDDLRKRGTGGAGGVAAVWLVAVVAVWLVWQGLSGWPAFEDDFDSPIETSLPTRTADDGDGDPEVSSVEQTPAEVPGQAAVPETVDSDAGNEEPAPEVSLPAPSESGSPPGVDLPYSVLVASHVSYEDAAAERDRLIESGSLAFIAPTPVRGRLYFRVFAGALEDRVQASDLMRRLVEEGDKRRERDWDMRPVRLAFALQDFSTEEDADGERQRLHEAGLPAYVLAVGDTTGAVYRLYSGAFESEGAAGPMDTLLSAAGQNAMLVTRRGEPR